MNMRPLLHAVTGVTAGQAGYVHYFLLRMPDETLEVQVGVELADQRIAWSFPDLGVVISPFIDGEDLHTGTNNYTVWHLYGVRPFPDDVVIARLDLPADLRSNLEELVYGMSAGDAAPLTARQKHVGNSPTRNVTPKATRAKPKS